MTSPCRLISYIFLASLASVLVFAPHTASAASTVITITKPANDLGLVGYWPMDEGTGTTVNDISGNGNTGTAVNASWTGGQFGNALSFDGSTQHVAILDNAGLHATDGTLSFWYKGTSDTDQAPFSADFSTYFAVELGPSSVSLTDELITIFSGSGAGWNGGFTSSNRNLLFDGNWHNIVITTDSTTHIYLDGVARTVTTGSGVDPGTFTEGLGGRFTIGAEYDGSNYVNTIATSGAMDDVRVYSRTLSPTEVADLYLRDPSAPTNATRINASTKTLQSGSTLADGLVGLWTFDGAATSWSSETTGTVTDESGNGNTGTLTNMSRSTSPVPGRFGQAFLFDGDQQYIVLDNNNDSLNIASGSVSFWYKGTQDVDQSLFTISHTGGTAAYFSVEVGPATANLTNELITVISGVGFQWEGGYTTADRNELFDGNWHQIVVTTDSSTHIYLDGIERTVTTGAYSDPAYFSENLASDLPIIGSGYFGGTYFQSPFGAMDDVRVYNRTLSPTEVAQLYKLGSVKITQ
jgi:hypothetical protein